MSYHICSKVKSFRLSRWYHLIPGWYHYLIIFIAKLISDITFKMIPRLIPRQYHLISRWYHLILKWYHLFPRWWSLRSIKVISLLVLKLRRWSLRSIKVISLLVLKLRRYHSVLVGEFILNFNVISLNLEEISRKVSMWYHLVRTWYHLIPRWHHLDHQGDIT